MGSARDERRGTLSVLTEQEDRRGIESERVREREREREQQRTAICLRRRTKVSTAPGAWRPAQTQEACLCYSR